VRGMCERMTGGTLTLHELAKQEKMKSDERWQ
jgi:hypothetical protein